MSHIFIVFHVIIVLLSLLIYFGSAALLLVYLILGIYRKIRYWHRADPRKADDGLKKEFRKLAARTKWKKWSTIVALIIVIPPFIISVASSANTSAMTSAWEDTQNQADIFNTIEAPNSYISGFDPGQGSNMAGLNTFSSSINVQTVKNLDGYLVKYEPQKWGYATLGNIDDNYTGAQPYVTTNVAYTGTTNQRIAQFFAVNGNTQDKYYVKPTQEVQTLAKLSNSLAEVAVTFDKPYSYAEIQQMVPKNLLINWYWIGLDNQTAANEGINVQYGLVCDVKDNNLDWGGSLNPNTNSADSQNLTGTLSEKSYSMFVSDIKKAQNYVDLDSIQSYPIGDYTVGKPNTQNRFYPVRDALKQVEKYPTLAAAKFSGVILTGRTENFAQLDNQTWAYATSIGLTTEYLPFQPTIK